MATYIAPGGLPSVENARAMYEATGGTLADEHTAGKDLLNDNPQVAAQRDLVFWSQVLPQIGTIDSIFGSCVNFVYHPLQQAIVEYIRLSEYYASLLT